METINIARVYVSLIEKGLKTIDDIPKELEEVRTKVEEILKGKEEK